MICTICGRGSHVAASCPLRPGKEDRGFEDLGTVLARVLTNTAEAMRRQDEATRQPLRDNPART